MIKLIASDMDGTLLDEKMGISATNATTIKTCQSMGIEFIVATGRARTESLSIVENAGLKTSFINLNGAMVYDIDGKLVVEKAIPKNDVMMLTQLLKQEKFYFELVAKDGAYSENKIARIQSIADLLVDLNRSLSFKQAVSIAGASNEVMKINYVDDLTDLITQDDVSIMKVIVFDHRGPAVLDDLSQKVHQIGNLITTSSSSFNLEINQKEAQKGIALLDYAQQKHISPNEIMAVGDNLNDESMIRLAGLGVAMGNAVTPIKNIAQYVTTKNTEDGVAHAINHFILEPSQTK